jgi:3-phytase
MINISKNLLTFSLVSCLASCSVSAESSWFKQSQFLKKLNVKNTNSVQHIAVSETLGLGLLDKQFNPVNTLNINAEHLDYRSMPNQSDLGVVATIDVNTGDIVLAEVNIKHPAITVKQRFKQAQSAFDAICLSSHDNNIDLFTVDVLGMATHYSIYQASTQQWQTKEVNRFAVGVNMKSCAVDELSESLYITEENIGVWRYSTNPEHEVVRQLIQLPDGLEIEYVDTSSAGDVVIVSPDVNALWFFNASSKQVTSVDLPKHLSPKTVQVTRQGQDLLVNVFDDESETLITKSITSHKRPDIKVNNKVTGLLPYGQTDPVNAYGDAADDPAIWINHTNPNKSLVYGTDKKHGLNVYTLDGKLLHELAVGRVNNVDIRYNVKLGNKIVDLAAASNRTTKSISLFAIDKTTGEPTFLNDITTDLADPYGLCMSVKAQQISVWINDTDGLFQRYELNLDAYTVSGQKVLAKKTMEWTVPSQPEGCVVDDETQRLFYGEEATGVWLKQIDSNKPDTFIAGIVPTLAADIEGMGLYKLDGKNYLIVSSQGNNRYAVYAVDDNNQFLGAFDIVNNWQNMVDGVSETDGLAVTNSALGKQLPNGLLVVQDGRNVMPKAPQNFKLVDGTLLKDWINQKLSTINN